MLTAKNLVKTFHGLKAIDDVSLQIQEGSITALIGPNGAGKSTTLNMISGALSTTAGHIVFQGTDITRSDSVAIAKLGIIRIFQHGGLFEALDLTVRDNLLIGGNRKLQSGFLSTALRLPSVRAEEAALRQRVDQVIAELKLEAIADSPVRTLPFGRQRLVEIGRALVAEPKLLLLDEPAAGLNDGERAELGQLLLQIKERKITIMLIEHHMDLVFSVADWIYVLNHGTNLTAGTPREISQSPVVEAAYLG